MEQELLNTFADDGEVYFRFEIQDQGLANKLSSIVDIDKVDANSVYAYANKESFDTFLSLNIPYRIITETPVDEALFKMAENIRSDEITAWDFYPTYEAAHIDMMDQFQRPTDICHVFSIGKSGGPRIKNGKLSRSSISGRPNHSFYTQVQCMAMSWQVMFCRG